MIVSIKITMPEKFIEATPVDVKSKKDYIMSGVYVFYDDKDVPLYVGKTVNFKSRFSGHAKSSKFFRLAAKVRLYLVKSEYEKDIYETYLINELKPEFNRDKTYYFRPEYEEMLQKVEERIIDIKLEIDELMRTPDEEDVDDEYVYLDTEEYNLCLLGDEIQRTERIAYLEYQLKKLTIRKATLMGRLSR
jgi:hypothetical protein